MGKLQEETLDCESKARKNDGERLRIVRKLMGLSQRELADLLKCSVRTVCCYEKGQTPISLDARWRVFQASGADVCPSDRFAEPHLVIREMKSHKVKAKSLNVVENSVPKPMLLSALHEFKEGNDYYRKQILKPIRRVYEEAIRVIYLTATIVLTVKQIQRAITGWDPAQALNDGLFITSMLVVIFLFFPAMQTIAWGMKKSS